MNTAVVTERHDDILKQIPSTERSVLALLVPAKHSNNDSDDEPVMNDDVVDNEGASHLGGCASIRDPKSSLAELAYSERLQEMHSGMNPMHSLHVPAVEREAWSRLHCH